MPISDAQYGAWLRADNKLRCVLVEAECYSGGGTLTRYLSNLGFVTSGTDTPAHTAYDDVVSALPGIRSSMAEVFKGQSLVSFGDIEIDNATGARDSWALDAWDGRPCRIYLGDPAWPKSDFRLSYSGALQDLFSRDSRTLVLRLRDRQQLLDVPVQTARVGGTGSTAGLKRPLAYGQVLNVPPVLIDATTRLYEVHAGQIEAIDAVRMAGADVNPANYTVDLANGRFTMGIAVSGELTCDVRGSKTGGVYVNKTADLVSRILQERAGFSSGDISATAVSALNAAAPGAAGLYLVDDAATVKNAIDALITGVGGYYTVGRDGVLYMGLFVAPAGSPVVTLTDDDIAQSGIAIARRIIPKKSVQVGYARYYSVITSGLAGSVTEAQRARLGQEYLVERATNTPTGYLLATDGDIEPTCFVAQSTAATEATRRAALWGVLRRVVSIKAFMAAGRVRLGDVVGLELGRFGLSGGALATVVGLRESLTGGSIDLEVFL